MLVADRPQSPDVDEADRSVQGGRLRPLHPRSRQIELSSGVPMGRLRHRLRSRNRSPAPRTTPTRNGQSILFSSGGPLPLDMVRPRHPSDNVAAISAGPSGSLSSKVSAVARAPSAVTAAGLGVRTCRSSSSVTIRSWNWPSSRRPNSGPNWRSAP